MQAPAKLVTALSLPVSQEFSRLYRAHCAAKGVRPAARFRQLVAADLAGLITQVLPPQMLLPQSVSLEADAEAEEAQELGGANY